MSAKTVIRVSCTDQVLKIVEAPVIASGGLNEIKVAFDFCNKWDGFAKTAVFYQDETEPYFALVGEDDTCVVPCEVCYSDGTFYFSVFGDKDDVRRTSVTLRYKVKKGAIRESLICSDPTPEIYDQVLAELARIRSGQETFIAQANEALVSVKAENEAFVSKTNNVLYEMEAEHVAFIEEAEMEKKNFLEASNKAVEEIVAEKDAFAEEANKSLEEIVTEKDAFVEETARALEQERAENDAFVAETLKALDDATKHNISKIEKTGKEGFVDIFTITYLDGSTKTFTVTNGKDGYTPQKGVDYFDGTSVTHEWNGTILKITSASGTSEADLKGEQGAGLTLHGAYETEEALNTAHPTGNVGEAYTVSGYLYVWSETNQKWINVGKIQGEPGKDGYTPQKGVDYFDGISPTVSVEAIEGGTRITIADANEVKTIDVMDGKDGQDGPAYVLTSTDKSSIAADVKASITLASIGAAPASHNQAASTITAGTFAGQVVANASGQTPGTSLLRNSKLVSADTNPTVNGEICWTYE